MVGCPGRARGVPWLSRIGSLVVFCSQFLELSGFCLWLTPSSELRGCLASVFPQFGSRWLPTLISPRIQQLGLSTLGFPQFRAQSLSASSLLPVWNSLVALFSPNSDLKCLSALASPPIWSLVLFHPQLSPQFGDRWFGNSLGIWSLGFVCSRLSLDLELGGCPPWAQLSGDVPSRVGLLLRVLPHPCIPTGTGASGKRPKCRRFHPGTALPGHARAKPLEVFCLGGDCRGPATTPFRSLQSVPLRSDPGSSCPGSVAFFPSSELCRLRDIGQSLRMAAPSKPS